MHFYHLASRTQNVYLRPDFRGGATHGSELLLCHLQTTAGRNRRHVDHGSEHFDSDGSMDLAGGFSLRSSVNSPLLNPHGLFGQLGPFANTFGPGYPEKPGWHPLTNNNNNPSENPLWVLLNESLK